MKTWGEKEAQEHFEELVEMAVMEGPQKIVREGAESMVIVDFRAFELMRLRKPLPDEIVESSSTFDGSEKEGIRDAPQESEPRPDALAT